jgi:hypothetical protein
LHDENTLLIGDFVLIFLTLVLFSKKFGKILNVEIAKHADINE